MAAATARPEPRGAWGRIDPLLTVALVAIVVLLAVLVAPYISVAPGPPSIRLAVADLRGHALVVMDTGDPGAARRIALPGGPHEFAALPDGRIAVSLEQFGTIALVDPRSGDVQSLRVGGTPHGLAVTADSLYVTDRSVNAVRRFSLATWVEGPSIASGAWPHTVEARPDGSLAIANAADDTLTLGDRAVAVSHVPESIAIASDGRVATAGAVGGALEVFDPTGTLVERHEVGGRPVRLLYDPRGTVLAASLSADGAIALVARDEVRRVAVGGVPDGLAFSPDGRWLYVGDMYGGAVSVVDVSTALVVRQLPAASSAGALLVLPSTRR